MDENSGSDCAVGRRAGRLAAALAALLAGAVLAAGCSVDTGGDDDESGGSGQDPTEETQADDTDEGSDDDEESTQEEEVEVDTSEEDVTSVADAPAIGSAQGSEVNSTLEIVEIERTSEDVVTASFRITVPEDAPDNFQISDKLSDPEKGFEGGQSEVSGATLVDDANATRYFVLSDTEGNCLCSTEIADGFIDQGQTVALYAKFPAPPEEVEEVSLTVPTFQSIDNVPITAPE